MKTFNKGFVTGLVLAIIGLLVVGGGVYMFMQPGIDEGGILVKAPEDTSVAVNKKIYQTENWKTYTTSKFKIDYPATYRAETSLEDSTYTTATFKDKSETISIRVSNTPIGFEDEWKYCAPWEKVVVGTTSVDISYPCTGNSYLMMASRLQGFNFIASVSEKEFNNPETRAIFKTMVASFTTN